jgi:hypothetical protein
MSVRLHIERLVLDGLDAAACDSAAISEAARLELAALVAAQPSSLAHGFSIDRVHDTPSTFAGPTRSASIGHALAHAVHRQLDPVTAPNRGRGS